MATYTQYSQAWLEDPTSYKALFIIVGNLYDSSGTGASYSTSAVYISSAGYVSSDGLISFNPILAEEFSIAETITHDGGITMSYSDIAIDNSNGTYDVYLDPLKYIWANQSIQIYLGDPSWSLSISDFIINTTKLKLVFNGVVEDIDSKSRSQLNFKIKDKLERLNTPVTEAKLGTVGTWSDATQNADSIKPLVFGEVFNMTPLLMDPTNGGGKYMVNDGPINELIEIRDNGVPIYQSGSTVYNGATVDTATGTFILTYPPAGAITASVKGIKNSINLSTGALVTGTYTNTIANLISLIVTQYGKATTRFSASDLDLTNLSAFDAANTQPVGYVVSDRENVLTVCNSLANSIGAQLLITREGKLQLIRYGVGITPAQDPNIVVGVSSPITEKDILNNTIDITLKLPIKGAVKLGYCKNWTVQDGLTSSLPSDHKSLFAEEWLTTTYTASSTLLSNYKLDTDPSQIDSMLLVRSDALAEATRLVNLYSSQKYIIRFSGTPKLLSLRLGQQVYLRHNRFNLYNGGSGKLGQVVTLSPNWSTGIVTVEVLI